MSQQKPIIVFYLQASRSLRTVWLLEELGVPYEVKVADRVNSRAPQEFKDASGNPMGKFPTIKDGDLTIWESGAITEYLCEKFDTQHRLIPADLAERAKVNMWIHGSESSFMMFGLSIVYARWNFPKEVRESNPEILEKMEEGLSANVQKAFDWLEGALSQNPSGWLVGDHLTAADIMTHFSASFLLDRKIGIKGKTWPKTEEWIKRCEALESYQRGYKRSGHSTATLQT